MKVHVVLFSGHMVDDMKREKPRFPEDDEEVVRSKIQKGLLNEANANHTLLGIAGCACGGDILFHELCDEMNIDSEIYLALPVDEFKRNSVSFAGKNWEERFDKLINSKDVSILPEKPQSEKNVWEQINEYMLAAAFEKGQTQSLIAVWDGKKGDGKGGTEHMIKICKEKGLNVNIIYI